MPVPALHSNGTVCSGHTGTGRFSTRDSQAVLPADYHFAAGRHGTHDFSITLKTAGTQSLAVADTMTPDFVANQVEIWVNPATARSFVVAGMPSTMTSGDGGYFSVSAYDAFGNLA